MKWTALIVFMMLQLLEMFSVKSLFLIIKIKPIKFGLSAKHIWHHTYQ
jgi:hypothetical protein